LEAGMSVMSSQDFSSKIGEFERLTRDGPHFITNGDAVNFVLLSYRDYKRLKGEEPSIADLLSMPADDDIEFEPPKLNDMGFKPAEFD
jgi:hypothetical protein